MSTTVIHIKDAPTGWKNNSQYVYVGRYNIKLELPGSPFQNPSYLAQEEDRDIVINEFREYFDSRPELKELAIELLVDKTLVCFCKPKACHGDILAEFVNGYQENNGKN